MRFKLRTVSLMLIAIGLMVIGPSLTKPRLIRPSFKLTSNVSVQLEVPETSIIIEGLSSPGTFIDVMDNGDTVSTATADSGGNFQASLLGIATGIHNLSLYGVDTDGLDTATINISVSAEFHSQTLISLYMPPTLSLAQSNVVQTKTDTLSGLTYPNSSVVVSFSNGSNETLQSDASGYWSENLGSLNLPLGSDSVFATATSSTGLQSYPSNQLLFTVLPYSAPPITPGTTKKPQLNKLAIGNQKIPSAISQLVSPTTTNYSPMDIAKSINDFPAVNQSITTIYGTIIINIAAIGVVFLVLIWAFILI